MGGGGAVGPRLSSLRGGRPLPYLGLILLAVLLVGVHVRAVPKLSPIDEFQHADALHRAVQGQLTTTGDLVGGGVRKAAACRGVEKVKLPPCAGSHAPQEFPDAGFDTADIHPPAYYFLTAWLSAPLRWTGLNEIDAGRLVGGLWLSLGLILLWEVALAIGASRPAAAAVCVLAATTVSVLEASASIGPDATAMAAGGLVTLAVIRVEEGRWPVWAVGGAGLFAGATKAHNLVAVFAGSVQRWLPATAGGRRRALVEALILVAAGGVVQAAWLLIRHALGHVGGSAIPLSQAEFVSSLPARDVIPQAVQFITPVNSPYTPEVLANWQVGIIHYILNVLLTGAALGGVLFLPSGSRARSVAIGTAIAALTGGPLLVIATYLATHSFVPSFPRYGLSLLPGMFALVAAGCGRRLPLAAVSLLGVVSLLAVMAYLLPAALR